MPTMLSVPNLGPGVSYVSYIVLKKALLHLSPSGNFHFSDPSSIIGRTIHFMLQKHELHVLLCVSHMYIFFSSFLDSCLPEGQESCLALILNHPRPGLAT